MSHLTQKKKETSLKSDFGYASCTHSRITDTNNIEKKKYVKLIHLYS